MNQDLLTLRNFWHCSGFQYEQYDIHVTLVNLFGFLDFLTMSLSHKAICYC